MREQSGLSSSTLRAAAQDRPLPLKAASISALGSCTAAAAVPLPCPSALACLYQIGKVSL